MIYLKYKRYIYNVIKHKILDTSHKTLDNLINLNNNKKLTIYDI